MWPGAGQGFMTFLSVMHRCRNIWLQIEGDQQFLIVQLLHMNCDMSVSVYKSVSVYFSAGFNFTVSYLDLYLYIIHIEQTEKLWTVIQKHIVCWSLQLCYITDLLVVCNGMILYGVLKDVELQGQQPFIVDLNFLNHYQQAQLFSWMRK